MPHIILPETFNRISGLITSIDERNTDLGDDSPAKLFMQENEIDLAADATATENAELHDKASLMHKLSSENFTKIRDLKMTAVTKKVTAICQLLKRFFKSNPASLGLWGITITASGKIIYPDTIEGMATLVTNIKTKHDAYAAGLSPLQAFLTAENISLANLLVELTKAQAADNDAKDQAAKSENETALRNTLLDPVLVHLNDIGNYLMKFYTGNPRELGLWGFVVDESTTKPTLRTSKLLLNEKITIGGVVKGSSVTCLGPGPIHLYKGKTTTGTPTIIQPGGKFGIDKGFSVITIANPSDIETVKFTAMTAR